MSNLGVKFEKFKEEFNEEIFIAQENFIEKFNKGISETEIKSIAPGNWAD